MSDQEPMSLEAARRMLEDAAAVPVSSTNADLHEQVDALREIGRVGDVSASVGDITAELRKLATHKTVRDGDLSALHTWASQWTDYAKRTGPLTERDWTAWEVGARGCYAAADMTWPGRVVRVPSPAVGSVAAPLAAWWLRNHWRWTANSNQVESVRYSRGQARARSVRDTVEAVVKRFGDTAPIIDDITAAIHTAINIGNRGGLVRKPFIALTDDQLELPHFFTAQGALLATTDEAAFAHAADAGLPLTDHMPHRINLMTQRVDEELRQAVPGDLISVIRDGLRDIDTELAQLNNRGSRIFASSSRANLTCYGRFAMGKHALWSFFRDVMELELPNDAWAFSRVLQAAQSAGPWWAMPEVVMVSELPTSVGIESITQTVTRWAGTESRRMRAFRLHSEDGPALGWADGTGMWAWHGTIIPQALYEHPTLEDALKAPNAEIRRAAFEIMGWDQVIAGLEMEPIDRCPDPGNAPHELLLYELPADINPFQRWSARGENRGVNLLLMTNGSPDRSGALRQYGETVPGDITSALDAAAWQYGVSPKVYAQIARRT